MCSDALSTSIVSKEMEILPPLRRPRDAILFTLLFRGSFPHQLYFSAVIYDGSYYLVCFDVARTTYSFIPSMAGLDFSFSGGYFQACSNVRFLWSSDGRSAFPAPSASPLLFALPLRFLQKVLIPAPWIYETSLFFRQGLSF